MTVRKFFTSLEVQCETLLCIVDPVTYDRILV